MIILSLFDKYYILYCLDFCGNSTQQWPKPRTEPINLLSSITAFTQILGDGYTHTFLVKYTFEANLYSCLNRHSGWNFGVSNVGRSQQPFFRTFWFGFSEEACVDFGASLNKALKFADILPELLKHDWFVNSCAPPINWRFTGNWSDVAPSGEFPTLHPWTGNPLMNIPALN